jgi:hypothetical protein
MFNNKQAIFTRRTRPGEKNYEGPNVVLLQDLFTSNENDIQTSKS